MRKPLNRDINAKCCKAKFGCKFEMTASAQTDVKELRVTFGLTGRPVRHHESNDVIARIKRAKSGLMMEMVPVRRNIHARGTLT